MGAHEFGRLVDRAMIDGGMSQARLAVLVGELPEGDDVAVLQRAIDYLNRHRT